MSLYDKFHGTPPIKVRKLSLSVPAKGERLVKIGRLLEVVYRPEPPSRRRGSDYVHKFGDFGTIRFGKEKPLLVTDGKNLYVVRDKSTYYFSERGIIG